MKIGPRLMVLLVVVAVHARAMAQSEPLRCAVPPLGASAAAESIAREYLIQKVCVDSGDNALSLDPCKCMSPNRLRDLAAQEPVMYHKVDQQGVQRHDSYPARTPDGGEISVNPFDFRPFGIVNSWGDGYDVYVIRDGWVSASFTKDGGGFAQTFFGEGCKPYLGWALFPVSAVDASGVKDGEANIPIAGRYWEMNGEPWPGNCPSSYSKNSLTSWKYIKDFVFGGKGGSGAKSIDTVQVVHGYSPNPQFAMHGHLEVFYFTRPYGVTRWESWVTESQGALPADSGNCSGEEQMNYKGLRFVRKACRDWSAIALVPKAESLVTWPIPALNLLKNFHFSEGTTHWDRTGASAEGKPTNWSLRNSSLARDMKYRQPGGKGVSYLAINCDGKCTEKEAVFQDVSLARAAGAGLYTYAATVRSESGPGTIRLSITQLDANGKELSSGGTAAQVDEKNERVGGTDSVVLSGTFVSGTVDVSPKASVLRFQLSPLTSGTFDMIDAWLIRN